MVFSLRPKRVWNPQRRRKQRGVGGAGISRVDGAISRRTKPLCAVVQTPPPPGGSGGPSTCMGYESSVLPPGPVLALAWSGLAWPSVTWSALAHSTRSPSHWAPPNTCHCVVSSSEFTAGATLPLGLNCEKC